MFYTTLLTGTFMHESYLKRIPWKAKSIEEIRYEERSLKWKEMWCRMVDKWSGYIIDVDGDNPITLSGDFLNLTFLVLRQASRQAGT